MKNDDNQEKDNSRSSSFKENKNTESSTDQENKGEETAKKSFPSTDKLGTFRFLSTGVRLILVSLVLISVLYLLTTTGIGNLIWPRRAQGSLVYFDGRVVGSTLIGQSFESKKYFHSRPSSTDYDAMNSGSANLSPQNDKLSRRASKILDKFKEEGVVPKEVPASYITESGSALDPHVVPESAYLQVPRVSETTGIAPEVLRKKIKDLTQQKFLGLYGLERVNVLQLNLEVKKLLEAD